MSSSSPSNRAAPPSPVTAGIIPAPEIVSTPLGFTITIRTSPFTDGFLQGLGLNDQQIAAVHYLKEHGTITNGQYQKLNSVVASTDLNDMVTKHVLERRGTSRRDMHYVLVRGEGGHRDDA